MSKEKPTVDAQLLVEQFIPVTLANLRRQYPNGILHRMDADGDVANPRQMHPIFYGCYDWHSAVHSYWQVVRALRLFGHGAFADAAWALLDESFTEPNVANELDYLQRRLSFELPYGMAWLLQLMTELRHFDNATTARWRTTLSPLEAHAAERMTAYFTRLPLPIRSGVHSQTAFGMALTLDWARTANDAALAELIIERAPQFYGSDADAPLAYEPSAADFLSPTLAEADLMWRIWPPAEFSGWLGRFLGEDAHLVLARELAPVGVADASDGQLAHFAGLNMSRAWMLHGIANALPVDDLRRQPFEELAKAHRVAGLSTALHEDYMVSHWAPSFVMYLITA